jgi:hypothetical protein
MTWEYRSHAALHWPGTLLRGSRHARRLNTKYEFLGNGIVGNLRRPEPPGRGIY